VQVIMRHANLATTARYIQVAENTQQDAIAILPMPRFWSLDYAS
jgi:hypothetical protein